MPDTLTTNYNWIKPEVGASKATWGIKWNENITGIDAKVKEIQDKALAALPSTGGDLTANVNLMVLPVDLNHLANVKWVRLLFQQLMPLGQIMLWNSAVIPQGWSICNGQVVNSITTPNLTGRFILAAGSNPVNETGGSWTATVAGTVGGHVISYNEMCYHTHAITTNLDVRVYGGSHEHAYYRGSYGGGNIYAGGSYGTFSPSEYQTWTWAQNAAPYIGYQSASSSADYRGGNWAHDHPWSGSVTIVPMYYALYYIMRTSWPWAPLTP